MTAYYNENNPAMAAWLRELIKSGAIAPGEVADGIPGRVALLRGYGNAIVPQVAAEFVRAVM